MPDEKDYTNALSLSRLAYDLENIINKNRAYQIEWEYANQIEKESPLVKILGQTLNLDDTAIDNMFMEASKI